MAESRRRLSPDDRRNELLALGAEVFGQRPYDDVRIDEIAEGERLFEATNAAPDPEASMFNQVREGVLAYLRYDEEHPHGAWAAYIGIGASDPILRGIEDVDNDRQANRIITRIHEAIGGEMDSKVERDLRVTIYGWLSFTFEMCRQRLIDPSIDAGYVADACAHTLLDAIGRVPGVPAELAEAVAIEHR